MDLPMYTYTILARPRCVEYVRFVGMTYVFILQTKQDSLLVENQLSSITGSASRNIWPWLQMWQTNTVEWMTYITGSLITVKPLI